MTLFQKNTLYRTLPYTIKRADSFLSRFKGLMFKKKPLMEEALWIVPCQSIHTCFMTFPIDVVFLDDEYRISKVVRNLKPWRIVLPVTNARSVLELPAGTVELLQLKEMQIIKLHI
jgi:uncharacterized protein